jgi:hypothetical protein
MGWAQHAIEALARGETVTIRPRGHSMKGRVDDGQEVIVTPCIHANLVVGDVVLCKVNGREFLHLITAIDNKRYQIGNNRGHINGWIGCNAIYGKANV